MNGFNGPSWQEGQPLPELREFDVRVDYGRGHTTYWLSLPDAPEPVVRMHKDHAHDVAVRPYYVSPADRPKVLLGYVKLGRAWDAEQTEIGRVGGAGLKGRLMGSIHGPITQPGLGTLTPQRTGLAARVHRVADVVGDYAPDWLPGADSVDMALSARIRCAGPESPGFEILRHAGVRAEYRVLVHDERLSRLLVLAYLDLFNAETPDPRRAAVTLTTNPFGNFTENRRMRREKEARERREQ